LSQNSTKNQLLSLYDNTTKNSPDQDSTYQLPTQSAAWVVQNSIIDVIEAVSPSVVNIIISKNMTYFLQDPARYWRWTMVEKKAQIWWGSWIIASKDWLILTNKHVVEDVDAEYSVILNNWKVYTAQSVRIDPTIDIAVLQVVDQQGNIPDDLQPASFVDFRDEVRIWQFAIAIGNALAEYQNSVTLGIISALNRQLDAEKKDSLYIGLYQTDTPINPGNSWGPLLNIYWQVLWINTAITAIWDGIWFALPVNQQFIDATIDSLRTYNSIKRPFLWVEYVDLNKPVALELGVQQELGVFVQRVVSGTPADKADIQKGDIILSINDFTITKTLPFMYHIYQFKPNDTVEFKILRNDTILTKNIQLWTL